MKTSDPTPGLRPNDMPAAASPNAGHTGAGDVASPGLPMPADADDAQATIAVPPPPGFGRQMAQLVIIPAVIVIVAVGVALLFGRLASTSDSLDNHLLQLSQGSGAGKMVYDLQDPRYKDRGLAAYNIATIIPSIRDPAERRRVSDELTKILRQHVNEDEDLLHIYLLTALGQLGQENAVPTIVSYLDASRPMVRQGAVRGLLSHPDAEAARAGLAGLQALMADADPNVRAEAAAALGELARPGDEGVKLALMENLVGPQSEFREAQWNAAVALARLDHEAGSRFVADVLLNREVLARLPSAESGPGADRAMSNNMQDRVILSTLAAAPDMKDPAIWARIAAIADKDPNLAVRNAALEVTRQRERAEKADQ